MKDFIKKAEELRAIVTPHYNCAQSTVIPFAEAAGVSDETALLIAANFGGGMKRESVCGAVTGGLMSLGLFGVDDAETIGKYYRRLKRSHGGFLDCGDLLRINAEAGGEKKPHCDAMVYECVALVEEILKEKGKL